MPFFRYLRYYWLPLLGAMMLSVDVMSAPDVHFGPAPNWIVAAQSGGQQPDLRKIDEGYYVQLKEEEWNLTTDEDYHHNIRVIVSNTGVQNGSNLSIPFNPLYERLTIHHITVIRDGKTIDKLNKNNVKLIANEDELAMYIYNGTYSAYMILDDIRNGDKIEFDYTIKGSNPVFGGKFSNTLGFQWSSPVAQVHYCVLKPVKRTLLMSARQNAPQPALHTMGDMDIYEWNETNIQTLDVDGYAPSWYDPYPQVQISEYKNWHEVALWGYGLNKPEDKLTGALAARVTEIAKQYGSDTASLFRALVRVAQNEIRYMGVELGPYSNKASKPEKVFGQRYGDCKDKSMLLASMLRMAGIEASMTLVNTTDRLKIKEFLPAPDDFDHAIVKAHVNGRDIWVDATAANQGGTGTNLFFPNYGMGLILSENIDSLVTIPVLDAGMVKYTEVFEPEDEIKPVKLGIYTLFTKREADKTRNFFSDQSRAEIEKSYLDYYANVFPNIERIDSVTMNDNLTGDTLKTIEKYTTTDYFEYDSATSKYDASFSASMVMNELPKVEKNDGQPVAIKYPLVIESNTYVIAKTNWDIKPKRQEINGNGYHFTCQVSTSGDSLKLCYYLRTLKDNIAANEVEAYIGDRKKIRDLCYFSYAYTPASAASEPAKPEYNNFGIPFFFLTCSALLLYFMKVFRKATRKNDVMYPPPIAVGGWLILSIVGQAATLFFSLYRIVHYGYLEKPLWAKVGNLYGIVYGFELISYIIQANVAGFCLILVYYRRDILLKYIKLYYNIIALVFVIDFILRLTVFHGNPNYTALLATALWSVIWINYFNNSKRARATFVVPYPA